jgi:hypothetical protein
MARLPSALPCAPPPSSSVAPSLSPHPNRRFVRGPREAASGAAAGTACPHGFLPWILLAPPERQRRAHPHVDPRGRAPKCRRPGPEGGIWHPAASSAASRDLARGTRTRTIPGARFPSEQGASFPHSGPVLVTTGARRTNKA